MSTALPCFITSGVKAADARVLHSELSLNSVLNLISSNIWLSGRGDIDSTKPVCNASLIGTVESLEPETLVKHILLWISEGGGGTGCCYCRKISLEDIFSAFVFAPRVLAGSRVARMYEPLVLRGNVTIVQLIYTPKASEIMV